MSQKRARYDGPSDSVAVYFPAGAVYPTHTYVVERGHQLPADAPASLRDELLARDNWSEVAYTPPGEAKHVNEIRQARAARADTKPADDAGAKGA